MNLPRCASCEHFLQKEGLRSDLSSFCSRNGYDGLCLREEQFHGGHFVIRSNIEYCKAGLWSQFQDHRLAA